MAFNCILFDVSCYISRNLALYFCQHFVRFSTSQGLSYIFNDSFCLVYLVFFAQMFGLFFANSYRFTPTRFFALTYKPVYTHTHTPTHMYTHPPQTSVTFIIQLYHFSIDFSRFFFFNFSSATKPCVCFGVRWIFI